MISYVDFYSKICWLKYLYKGVKKHYIKWSFFRVGVDRWIDKWGIAEDKKYCLGVLK